MPRNTKVPLLLLLLLLSILLCAAVCWASASKPKIRGGLENSPLTEVEALEKDHVLLPCDVTPPIPNDETILVLFYRGSIGTPIYSIDGRNGPVRHATHWVDQRALGSRGYFDLSSRPPGLVLRPLTYSDQDEYRCRVDFRSSPTRNVRVNLRVIGRYSIPYFIFSKTSIYPGLSCIYTYSGYVHCFVMYFVLI
ncbi:uncharacterized protein [Procambarus clarkii]|uniref:uncharacterized protein n=1 Tax=Procambarus clarkii TaxID=6728 RepID=UPI00374344F9